MRYGVTMFVTDLSIGVVDLALAAEERGLDSLWLPEHTHIPTSRKTPHPSGGELAEKYKRSLDPLVALAAAATATTTLRLGTGILLPAQRDPIVTAKAVATLDHVSGGRVALGVGFGWNEDEIADHGVAFGQRRSVAREHVLAMQALWREDEAEFAGEHVTFPPSWAWPKPVQRDGDGGPRCRSWSAAAPARSCSPMPSSTPTGGSHRRCRPRQGAARPARPRWPRRAATRRGSRSSRSRRSPTTASSTTTTTWASPRPCSTCRLRPADEVLPILDRFAALVAERRPA